MNTKTSLGRKILLFSPVPALLLNLFLLMPVQPSNAALEPAPSGMARDEYENVMVYQQNSPAVVSINSGKNQGAGVILSSDGLIVTNKHVIQGTSVVTVKTDDERQFKANVVALGNVHPDLAFLRVQGKQTNLPFVRMGDSSQVRVGQRILAIGSPFGLDGTLTTGIISRIDKRRNMLQTDAAINPGNSGGPLLNTKGELIGINRSIVNPVGASSAGISFAVPVNVVKQEIANMGINSQQLARGYNH